MKRFGILVSVLCVCVLSLCGVNRVNSSVGDRDIVVAEATASHAIDDVATKSEPPTVFASYNADELVQIRTDQADLKFKFNELSNKVDALIAKIDKGATPLPAPTAQQPVYYVVGANACAGANASACDSSAASACAANGASACGASGVSSGGGLFFDANGARRCGPIRRFLKLCN